MADLIAAALITALAAGAVGAATGSLGAAIAVVFVGVVVAGLVAHAIYEADD